MSFEAYKKRLGALGANRQEMTDNVTKINQHNMLLNSPSKREVKVNDEDAMRPCLVSDVETFYKRRFLFLPETEVSLGDYIYYENKIYLTTDKKTGDIYPESFADFCDKVIEVSLGKTRVDTGKVDFQGRPIYKEEEIVENVPVHTTTKVYSALSNQPISLPTGAIIVKLPYKKEFKIPLNYVVEVDEKEYRVMDIIYNKLSELEGIIELHAQREVVTRE